MRKLFGLLYRRCLILSLAVMCLSACGGGSDRAAEEPVASAPVITAQPENQSTILGQSATFSVAVDGSVPLTYQWYKNSVPVEGATSASYTLESVQLDDDGSVWFVVASNNVGSVTSNEVRLAVQQFTPTAPVITVQPEDQSAVTGQTVTFSVEAEGAAPLVYQWYRNGSVIPGANQPSYMLVSAQATDANSTWSVGISNDVGEARSRDARLTVAPSAIAPVVKTAPQGQSVIEGQPVTFSVKVSSGTAPLSYQWYRDGHAVPGATQAKYKLEAAQMEDDGSEWSVVVSNSVGSVTSASASLRVTPIALSIQSALPMQATVGGTVVLTGNGFKAGMVLKGNGVALEYDLTSATELVFTVPSALASAQIQPLVLTLLRLDGQTMSWPSDGSLKLLPTIEVDPLPTKPVVTGSIVTLTGKRLNLVTKVCIGTACDSAPKPAANGLSLSFSAPGVSSGTLVLTDTFGNRHSVGNLVVGPAPAGLQLADVQLAQANLLSVKAAPSPYARWVGGRSLLVRAKLLSDTAGRKATVKLQATQAGTTREFTMQGPATVPTTVPSEQDLDSTWTYEVPASLVAEGLTLEVTAEESNNPNASPLSWSYSPNITKQLYARLVLIPIEDTNGAKLPDDYSFDLLTKNVKSMFPVTEMEVVVAAEPLVAAPSKKSGVWLKRVAARRRLENPPSGDFYMGVMNFYASGGLAYLPGTSSVVVSKWYGRIDYAQDGEMPHELGHNFGRIHSFDDAKFPYPNNRLGGDWGINLLRSNTSAKDPNCVVSPSSWCLFNPSKWYDFMSYSFPSSGSAYTFYGMHTYALGKLPSVRPSAWTTGKTAAQSSKALLSNRDVLLLIGEYNRTRNTGDLQPAMQEGDREPDLRPAVSEIEARSTSSLVLRLTLSDGSVKWYALPTAEIEHHPEGDVSGFDVAIPLVNDIRQVALLTSGKLVYSRTYTDPQARLGSHKQPYTLTREGDKTRIRWNTSAYAYMSVVHTSNSGKRTALLVNDTRGDVLLPGTSAGQLSLHLSDGANTRRFVESL